MSVPVQYTKPFTVLVEGNLGSGKTTLLQHFRQFEKDITMVFEPLELWQNFNGWNLYDLMFKDPSKWAMPFEAYVSLTVLDMHRLATSTPVKFMERSLFSACYIFVEQMLRKGMLHPIHHTILNEWFQFIQQQNPIKADLIVYLRTTPSVVYPRIKQRARSEEQCVPLSYIEDLHRLHEDWLIHRTHAECPAPVLVIDADLDLSQIKEEYKRITQRISNEASNIVMNAPNNSIAGSIKMVTPISL